LEPSKKKILFLRKYPYSSWGFEIRHSPLLGEQALSGITHEEELGDGLDNCYNYIII